MGFQARPVTLGICPTCLSDKSLWCVVPRLGTPWVVQTSRRAKPAFRPVDALSITHMHIQRLRGTQRDPAGHLPCGSGAPGERPASFICGRRSPAGWSRRRRPGARPARRPRPPFRGEPPAWPAGRSAGAPRVTAATARRPPARRRSRGDPRERPPSLGVVLGPLADPRHRRLLGAIGDLKIDALAKLLLGHLRIGRREHGPQRRAIVAPQHLVEGGDHAVRADHSLGLGEVRAREWAGPESERRVDEIGPARSNVDDGVGAVGDSDHRGGAADVLEDRLEVAAIGRDVVGPRPASTRPSRGRPR